MGRNKHGVSISVNVRGDYVERAIRKFSKLTVGLVSEYKKAHRHYTKPSIIRYQRDQYKKRQRLIDKGIIVIKKKRRRKEDKNKSYRSPSEER